MNDLNTVALQGRLEFDPKISSDTHGEYVCAFLRSCRKNRVREHFEEDLSIWCICYKPRVSTELMRLHRGDEVIVNGRLFRQKKGGVVKLYVRSIEVLEEDMEETD